MTVNSILLRLTAGVVVAALFAGVQANAGPLSTLRFVKGESPAADFTARGSAYSLTLRRGEFTVALRPGKEEPGHPSPMAFTFPEPAYGGGWLVSSHLVGADREVSAEGLGPMQSRAHYLLGAEPANWRTDVLHYGRVRYREVYPGIDVEYYGNEGRLEYDFILAPGADPDLIRVRFEGAESIEIDGNGDLVLRSGNKELRQHKPLIYQTADGERVGVEGRYRIAADRTVSIETAAYDVSRSLVIDPVVNWSRTFPGDGLDLFVDVAVDEHGFIYVAGTVGSTNLPQQDPLQPGNAGGFADAYVLKLAPDGQELIYATYLGGSAGDVSNGVAVDSEGSLYVSGATDSPNFPTTPGAFQTAGAGDVDNFVVKLSPDGSSIVYSTLLGGPGRDFNEGLAIDDTGNAYVVGRDNLGGFPTTPGALQTAHAGEWDAFAAKLNADGSDLIWATYHGGSQGEIPAGIEVDDQHRAFLYGNSSSPNLPTTPDAFQRQSAGGADLFLARLTEAGDALSYATLLGGSGDEFAGGFDLDPFGNVWMTGGTDSLDLPFAPGSEHPDFLGGPSDGFVVSLPLPEAITFPVLPPAGLQKGGLRKGMTQTTWGGYLGDGNRNFGLAINVREAYGRGAVMLSLSNFVSGSGTVAGCGNETRSGVVGKLLQFDLLSMYRGGDAVCGNGVDYLALASNHQGDVVGVGFDEGGKDQGGLATSIDGSSFFSAPGETALEVKKTVTTDIPGIVGFKITVKNVGDETAFNVRVVDILPFQPLDAPVVGIGEPSRDTISSFSASMNTLTIPLPAPLSPGESETLTVAVGENHKGKFVNVAVASADNAGTAIAEAEFELLDPVNVTIRKTTSADGRRFKSTITVTNEGETDASGLRVVDSFPTPASNVSASADKGTCESGEVFRQVCSLPALPKGDTWTIMVDATAGLDLAKNAKNVAVLTVAQFNIGNEIAEALLEEGGGSSTPNARVILNSRRQGGASDSRLSRKAETTCRGVEADVRLEGPPTGADVEFVLTNMGRAIPAVTSKPDNCNVEAEAIRCALGSFTEEARHSLPFVLCADAFPAVFSLEGRVSIGEQDPAPLDDSSTLFVRVTENETAPTIVINPNGITDKAKFGSAGLTPGTDPSLFGTGLAPGVALAESLPLPRELLGTSVEVNGVRAPIVFVSPTQINFQAPWEIGADVSADVVVRRGIDESDPERVFVVPVDPGIFTLNQSGSGQGAILIAGTASVSAPAGSTPGARPAQVGEFISIFCIGLGPVDNPPASGTVSPVTPLARTLLTPTATIGGANATVQFSGLAPGFVGIYQVNVQIPAGTPAGDAVDLQLTIGGVSSNVVTIAVAGS